MTTYTVGNALQEAREGLKERRPGETRIMHDHRRRFVSRDWRNYLKCEGTRQLVTPVAHPESSGQLDRLHRTHREAVLIGEATESYRKAVETRDAWSGYYNWARPHSALRNPAPGIYYRGDPEEAVRYRQQKLKRAKDALREYRARHGE